ncbi:hypothetical protein I4U23_011440 [Adineta vaga]|nr:hypothetical protein I4U23_011440 [Adineta vaga]
MMSCSMENSIWNPRGKTVAGLNNELDSPFAVIISKNSSSMFVADTHHDQVLRYTPDFSRFSMISIGTNIDISLVAPASIALTENENNLLVTSFKEFYGFRHSLLTNKTSLAAQHVTGGTTGVAVDQRNNVYIGFTSSTQIRRYEQNTNPSRWNGSWILSNVPNMSGYQSVIIRQQQNKDCRSRKWSSWINTSRLRFPWGVAVDDREGHIFVSDTGNHRIQLWMVNSTEGITIAGLVIRVYRQKRRLRQSNRWSKQRRMIIQLTLVSGLNIILNTPIFFIPLLRQFGLPPDFGIQPELYFFYFGYFVVFLFPFASLLDIFSCFFIVSQSTIIMITSHENQFELQDTTLGDEFSHDKQPIVDKGNINLHYRSNMKPNQLKPTTNRGVQVIPNDVILKQMNAINDTVANLGPIVGYAEEPLVTLTEACAPLITLIDNLSIYVQQALNATSKSPPNGLTIDEKLPFPGACLYPKNERSWYRKKRFIIPIGFITLLCITAISLGSVLGTRNLKSVCKRPFEASKKYNVGIAPSSATLECYSIGLWNDTYAKGEIVRVEDMDVYTVGSNTNSLKDLSIIVFYDIYGFNISQTRVFCDRLAAEYEVQVVMPDFYRGKSASVTTPHLIAWVAQVGNWSQVSIDLKTIASWLRNTSLSSSRRIALIGFCWGGLQVARACSNLSNLFVTGISIHGAWLTEDEVKNLQQPVFFIAAGDDPPLQPNISTVIEQSASSRVSSQCQYETYSNMKHGFVSTGANYSDSYNVAAIDKVHETVKIFLDKISRNSSFIMSYSPHLLLFFFLFLLFNDNIKPY